MEGGKYFSLYLITTNQYLLTFIFELCLIEDPTHEDDYNSKNSNHVQSPKIKYTIAELLNLEWRAYIAKLDTDVLSNNS